MSYRKILNESDQIQKDLEELALDGLDGEVSEAVSWFERKGIAGQPETEQRRHWTTIKLNLILPELFQ